MSVPHDRFVRVLRAHNQSITKTRTLVFEKLIGQEPMSMAELVTKCNETDRASVYRSVALFEELGIAQRIHHGWKYKIELSDKFTAHHHHLTCTSCGNTIAINEDALESFVEQIALQNSFKAQAHQIEVQGSCAKCAASAVA